MKRFITLVLMLTTLLTFSQKVIAFAPLLESETASMANCPMSSALNKMQMDKTDCANEMSQTMDCQSDCEFMTVVSVLYFINHEHAVNQPQLLLTYHAGSSSSPCYFPEALERPPLLN